MTHNSIHYDDQTDQFYFYENGQVRFFTSILEAKDALRQAELRASIASAVNPAAQYFTNLSMDNARLTKRVSDLEAGLRAIERLYADHKRKDPDDPFEDGYDAGLRTASRMAAATLKGTDHD